jgi:hypothetical protein
VKESNAEIELPPKWTPKASSHGNQLQYAFIASTVRSIGPSMLVTQSTKIYTAMFRWRQHPRKLF